MSSEISQQGCGSLKLTGDYNLHWNMKIACPKLTAHKATPAIVSPLSGSPALSTGKAVEVALFHTPGDLPEPGCTHRFCRGGAFCF